MAAARVAVLFVVALDHCSPRPHADAFPLITRSRRQLCGRCVQAPTSRDGRGAASPPPPSTTTKQSMIASLQWQIKSLEDIIDRLGKELPEAHGGLALAPASGFAWCPAQSTTVDAASPAAAVSPCCLVGKVTHQPLPRRARRALLVPKVDPPCPPLREVPPRVGLRGY